MDLLVSPSLIEGYFSRLLTTPKTEFDRDVSALLSNPLNRFLISKDYINLLEKYGKSNNLESILLPFLSELINNQSMIVEAEGKLIPDEVIVSIDLKYKSLPEKTKKNNSYLILSENDRIENNSINFKKLNKPSRDWLLFKTCCYHPASLTIRYYEFKSDDQIDNVIKAFLEIEKPDSIINIADRQTNFNHSLFDSFRKTRLVHYYTSNKSVNEAIEDFKSTFTTLKVFTTNPKFIHERKIFVKYALVELDDDFWNITVSKDTWKIEFTYCSKVVSTMISKVSKFSRYIIR